jgi:hypothetical protein
MTIHLPTIASMNPPSSILYLPFNRFSGDVTQFRIYQSLEEAVSASQA